ncbi:MAG: SIMPL domain-containing protein, partial [Deltaproteobacteria bacterium]|nr:SIMPL domain-containing protein [Deltaproteobacteria bacterium]
MSANRSDSGAMKRSGFLPGLALGVVILLAGAGIFRSAGAAAAQGGPQPATIEVEATGEVRAQPDIATLTPAVETQASTVEEARAANARASQALLQAVKGALQEKEKIQSVSYRLYPVYRSVEKVRAGRKIRTREIVGYKAEHVFRLELRDLSRLGKMIDLALKNGANRVGGPYFDHSRRDEL